MLKRQRDPSRAERVLSAFPLIQYATDRGWPVARWLSSGRLADGTAFVLQEYVRGEPVTQRDVKMMAAILAANDSQAQLAHPDAFNDSAQLTAVSTNHPWRTAVAQRSTSGAALVRHGDALTAIAGRHELPIDDVVHGDFGVTNMLVTDQGIVLVDCETVGRGTRVRDLADLYRECFIYPGAPADAMDLLQTHATQLAGPHVFTACIVGVTYNNLAWWVENKSQTDFDIACTRAEQLFETCSALCR